MAKRKTKEVAEEVENVAEENNALPTEEKQPLEENLETTKKQKVVAEKRVSTIELRNPADKLVLRKKNGKPIRLTIDEALKERNFRRLSESSQKALTQGKSASQIVREQEEQE